MTIPENSEKRSAEIKVLELEILGQKIAVKSDEDEEYIKAVESYLNHKVHEVKSNSKAVSTLDLALLAALNVTGELIKTKETLETQEKRFVELTQLIDRRME
jgi:cell division protein ZapA (FtsZ GTPase activity inhibitor)